jgi:CheY-like chemotaxis protein
MTTHTEWTRRRRTTSGIAPRMQRLLVVDDEPLAVEALVLVMADVCELRATTDPNEALAWVAAGERFDALLVDVVMPELNGVALYRAIDAIAPSQAGRMIFMTGGVVPPLSDELERLPNPRLVKPFDLGELLDVVRGLIVACGSDVHRRHSA